MLDWIDDSLNPIVVKELREVVQSRIVVLSLLVFLAIQVTLFTGILSIEEAHHEANMQSGLAVFSALQVALLSTCMLLIPAYAGVRLAAERSDTNVDLLFISALGPGSIVSGKLFAAMVLCLMIFSACAPFMTFCYLMGGVDIPTILTILFADFLTVMLSTQFAICLAAIPANRGLKIFLGFMGLSVIGNLLSGSLMMTLFLAAQGLFFFPADSLEFWSVLGTYTAGVGGIIGVLFTWSVALLSPPSSNRALPVRLFLLGFWAFSGGVALAWSLQFHRFLPIRCWMTFWALFFSMNLFIVISEREELGPRLISAIPRSTTSRWLAFPFYSGAAGGIFFVTGLLVLTFATVTAVGGVAFQSQMVMAVGVAGVGRLLGDRDIAMRLWPTFLVGYLYIYTYCLLAVLVRRSVFRNRLQPAHTWLVAMILIGLGSTLPFMLAFVLDADPTQARFGNRAQWWKIGNPFVAVSESLGEQTFGQYFVAEAHLAFVGPLAVAATFFCIPWFSRQIRNFQPPYKAPELIEPVEAPPAGEFVHPQG